MQWSKSTVLLVVSVHFVALLLLSLHLKPQRANTSTPLPPPQAVSHKQQVCSPNGLVCLLPDSSLASLVFTYAGSRAVACDLSLKDAGPATETSRSLAQMREVWEPKFGPRSHFLNHYVALVLELRTKDARHQLEIRLHNHAFMYQFRTFGQFEIKQELELHNEFSFASPGRMWVQNRGESEYWATPFCELNTTFRHKTRPQAVWLPATIELPELYLSLMLAGYANVSSIWAPKRNSNCAHVPGFAIDQSARVRAGTTASVTFPWMAMAMGASLAELVEHSPYLLETTAAPSTLLDASWVKPGKVYRDMQLGTNSSMEVIRFAREHNMQYLLLDAGWYGNEYNASSCPLEPLPMPKLLSLDLPTLIAYGRQHGIGVFLYVNDIALRQWWPQILNTLAEWGVAGIKFGFVSPEPHDFERLMGYVKDCMQRRILVNIHDDFRPTGLSRTFPNLISQEGIRGNEHFPGSRHNCMLPFTRFLAGAADYTFVYRTFASRPCLKHERQDFCDLSNTIMHQIALPVVFYSPLQHLFWYQAIGGMREPRTSVAVELDVWKRLPTTWRNFTLLDGVVGEYAVMARETLDHKWWVGAITHKARQITIDFRFLPQHRSRYIIEAFEDTSRDNVVKEEFRVTTPFELRSWLIDDGGLVLIISEL